MFPCETLCESLEIFAINCTHFVLTNPLKINKQVYFFSKKTKRKVKKLKKKIAWYYVQFLVSSFPSVMLKKFIVSSIIFNLN